MDKAILVNIILAVVCAIIGIVAQFISAYLKAKGVVTEEAAHQIAVAEEVYSTVEKAGERKKNLCIDALYDMIPAPVKMFFTREMIGEIVQKVFDEVEKYKNVWIESSAEKLAQKLEEEQLEANAAE